MRLSELVENFERGAFEAWCNENMSLVGSLHWDTVWHRYLYPEHNLMWQAWKARAAQVSQCRGVSSPTCDYLSPCNAVCDKCGKKH